MPIERLPVPSIFCSVLLAGKNKIKTKQSGGVIRTKGILDILDGNFLGNRAKDVGGVIISSDNSTVTLKGGVFEGNNATDGGVVDVGLDSELLVTGGNFSHNEASNRGGVFFIGENCNLAVGECMRRTGGRCCFRYCT